MKNTIKKMIKAIAGICALAAVFAMSDNTGGTALAMSVVAGVAGGEFHYKKSSLTQKSMISMMRQAFTGNAGNKRKVLIGGSGLIELLNQMEQTKVVMAGENIVKWGIDFSEMHSKFGKLYILLSEVFDECGMEYNGMIIDPEYLQKYSHIPFTTEQLNLKQAGVRNTDALVLTEASCMTLRYPKAHLRIIGE